MDRRHLLVGVVLLVAISGCASFGSGGSETTRANEFESGGSGAGGRPTVTETAAMATPSGDGSFDAAASEDRSTGSVASTLRDRAIVFSGHVSIEVADFEIARRNLTLAVERYGGYASDASREVHRVDGATYTTGRLVLRVPRANFSATMERVRAAGEVLSSSRTSRDVTGELVDIGARLRNLRAQRDRLRSLYRNASDTEAILRVEERLSEVQTEIERLTARRKSLRGRVAMSTIEVELREPRPEPEPTPVERWYETGVRTAFLDSIHGVVVVIRATVVTLAYALPYLLAFGVPVGIAGYLAWRRRSENDGE